MIVAVVALALLAAGLGGLVATLVVWQRRQHVEIQEARAEIVVEARRSDAMQAERDALAVDKQRVVAERAALETRLAVAEEQRNRALAEGAQHVVERIRASDLADAARLIDELLAAPLPGATATGSAVAGDRDRAAGAVQPAPAATAGDAGRRP